MHISEIRDIAIIIFIGMTMMVNLGAYVRAKLQQIKMTRKGKRK